LLLDSGHPVTKNHLTSALEAHDPLVYNMLSSRPLNRGPEYITQIH